MAKAFTEAQKHERLKFFLEEAEEFNKWQTEAKANLLTNIGPRIEALRVKGYYGCGFHYGMEATFGKLVASMVYPLQPCMNHFDKCFDKSVDAMLTKVIYEELLKDVEKAEKSS